MKTKTTYSSEKDFQKLRENGFKLNVGDKIKLSFCLPGKEGLYPPVECHKEGATLIQKTEKEMLFVMDRVIFDGPVDTNNCKEYAKTELAQYLNNEAKEVLSGIFKDLETPFETPAVKEVRLLSVGEVFGASDFEDFAACTDEQLKYFKKGNHRIAFDKDEDYSRWWWLSTPTRFESASFCACSGRGSADFTSADHSRYGVRFAFLIQYL